MWIQSLNRDFLAAGEVWVRVSAESGFPAPQGDGCHNRLGGKHHSRWVAWMDVTTHGQIAARGKTRRRRRRALTPAVPACVLSLFSPCLKKAPVPVERKPKRPDSQAWSCMSTQKPANARSWSRGGWLPQWRHIEDKKRKRPSSPMPPVG